MKTNLRLRAVREKHGLSMRELSQGIEIPYHTYANYENGGRRPPYDVLIKIANFLQVTTDELLGRSPLSAVGFTVSKISEDSYTIALGSASYTVNKAFIEYWENEYKHFAKTFTDMAGIIELARAHNALAEKTAQIHKAMAEKIRSK